VDEYTFEISQGVGELWGVEFFKNGLSVAGAVTDATSAAELESDITFNWEAIIADLERGLRGEIQAGHRSSYDRRGEEDEVTQ